MSSPRRARLAAILTTSLLAIASLAGCATSADTATPADSASGGTFPVSIEHAFGSTEIEAAPERVVTWGWGSTEAAIALGTVPVAMPFDNYAGDDEGVLPWTREALQTQGTELPIVLPDSEEPPYEDIAARAPDLILAVYSGITEEQYDLLSEIAPTVAYPDAAWTTPWKDVVEIVGDALGKSDQATEVLADIDSRLATEAADHPELDGKTVAAVWDIAGTFYVYRPADSRVEFLLDLGLSSAPSVEALANGESSFFYTLSYEQLDRIDADILVNFADTDEAATAFTSSSYGQAIPAVQNGAVANIVGTDFIASVSPPTALSLTYALDEYVDLLADAAANVG